MSLTILVLVVLTVIYVPIWYFAWRSPRARDYKLEKYGPTVKVNTRMGIKLMDRLCVYRRFWKFMGAVSQVMALALMALMIYVVVAAVINLPNTIGNGGMGVEYILAVPGLNPLLPFWYGLAALIVALVCHEFAHGVQARANGLRVRNTGLLYAVVPLGAFVEPEEEDVKRASRRARLDLYAAGIATNLVIGVAAFLLFSTLLLGGLSSPYENNAAVYGISEDSPAADAGLPAGSIILEVEGEEFSYYGAHVYSWDPGSQVTVTYATENGTGTADMRWGVYVYRTVEGGAAYVHGLTEGCYIVSIDGNKFYTAGEFSDFMSSTSGGQTVSVVYVDAGGTQSTMSVVLDSNGSRGYLGVYTNVSGMNLLTPSDIMKYSADPLYGYDDLLSVGQGLLKYLSHPLSGFDPVPESIQWWYGDQSDMFWIIVSLLYWIFWINILLGISNAIPAFPFDGGYIFLGWVDKALEKMGVRDAAERDRRATEISGNVSMLMLFLYVLIIVFIVL